MKMNLTACLIIFVSSATPVLATGNQIGIVLGGNSKFDACMSQGQIVGLNPNGDGFLSVRSGPGGSAYFEKDRLHNGDIVQVCGFDNEPWYPVIYDRSGRKNCNVGTPWPVRSVYTGPCQWGWIHKRYVKIVAG